ncbi:hypothetical protein [Burkholderia pyrrocinia]|uniref:hypothetical protein n=1 Tax=Burkholderia pyrrocinia TaxID=60550 RepID=UPI002AB249BE|nr:hypothetical protein [Burkholderia pyrrocinia]
MTKKRKDRAPKLTRFQNEEITKALCEMLAEGRTAADIAARSAGFVDVLRKINRDSCLRGI